MTTSSTRDRQIFEGKTALITGASDGIGFEIARSLASSGARLLLPVRNRVKGQRAAVKIQNEHCNASVEVLDLDLARLRSVHALTNTLLKREETIDFMMLNAGIVQLAKIRKTLTKDGFELAFQTNFLGHFGLTVGLLPLLRASHTRLVIQCSLATMAPTVLWEGLLGQRPLHSFNAYRLSKTALGLFGQEFSRRGKSEGWGTSVNFCHPGVAPGSAIAPEVRRLVPKKQLNWLVEHMGNPPHVAASTAIAALAAEPQERPSMFVPSGVFQLAGAPRETTPLKSFDSPGDANMLWRLAARWSGTNA